MPALKTYDLFLSHTWRYNDDYYRLEQLLRNASNFKWRNYSVPVHDPLVDPNSPVGKRHLESLLNKQIRPANCVLIIGGMDAGYSEWVPKEIRLAQSYSKPIIAIYPRGNVRMPVGIQNAAHEIVNWNTLSIVSAIRRNSI